MRFLSVCSGIDAASVAWGPLGWLASGFSEIEPFPSAVLAHHYPDVPNHGDMTQLPRMILEGDVDAPDILTGGTPCQAFSVAGMRAGLTDPRGALTITFVRILDAIDHIRRSRGYRTAVAMWENVPGVLSDKGNAFGCFLAALVGESEPLQPSGGKWTDAGCVYGPARTVAWRVLDAQYFGLAQRRRRVFVVASAGTIDPCAVLFELDRVRRDTAPRREAGQDAAAGAGCGAAVGGEWPGNVAPTLTAAFGAKQGMDNQHLDAQRGGHFVPVAFHANAQADQLPTAARDTSITDALTCSQNAAVAIALRGRDGGAACEVGDDAAFTLRASQGGGDKPHVLAGTVRRLTPRECERLQGFPDDYTAIPWRGKDSAQCPDGQRYKALGNSWAVPCARWIGERIQAQIERFSE